MDPSFSQEEDHHYPQQGCQEAYTRPHADKDLELPAEFRLILVKGLNGAFRSEDRKNCRSMDIYVRLQHTDREQFVIKHSTPSMAVLLAICSFKGLKSGATHV